MWLHALETESPKQGQQKSVCTCPVHTLQELVTKVEIYPTIKAKNALFAILKTVNMIIS